MGDTSVSRRQLLGTISVSALAGCMAADSESKVQVGNVFIGNWQSEPVTLLLRLDRAETTVYEDSIEVDSEGYELIEQSWDSDPAEYQILYSSPSEEQIHHLSLPDDITNEYDSCVDIQIHCRSDLTDIVFRDDNPEWGSC